MNKFICVASSCDSCKHIFNSLQNFIDDGYRIILLDEPITTVTCDLLYALQVDSLPVINTGDNLFCGPSAMDWMRTNGHLIPDCLNGTSIQTLLSIIAVGKGVRHISEIVD